MFILARSLVILRTAEIVVHRDLSGTTRLIGFLVIMAAAPGLVAQAALPREDVIDKAAIGQGLCLHNLFQSNMVLQRDKPIRIWGWATPGEKVTVTFAGEQQPVVADQDRSWKVTLPAMPAHGDPLTLTVTGNEEKLELENKIPAGERIARWALAAFYDKSRDLRWKPPLLEERNVEEDRLVLKFDAAVGAVDDGSPMVGFAIAGEDRKFHPADAAYLVVGKDDRGRPRQDRKTLVLTSPMVPKPVHFRYAWARSPLANIQAASNSDIPLGTQRSDDWPMENIPLGVLGDDPSPNADRGQRRTIQQALRREDLRRRYAEAEAFVREHRDALGEAASE